VSAIIGDCRAILPTLEACSVQAVVTSPPYWGLRDYGHPDQIGLEPTPSEYVASIVGVMREVRRVLREDGTLWLNLGDSYVAGGAGEQGESGQMADWSVAAARCRVMTTTDPKYAGRDREEGRPNRKMVDGLKRKDLVGIPWRVAFALQQPYYTGTIRDERDRIWLAAMLDAEGCIFIHKRKAGQSNGQGYQRQNDSYAPGIEIANTSRPIIDRIMAIVGRGSVCSQGPEQNGRRRQTIHRWNLRTTECRDFLREVYPYLVAKQQQARIAISCPTSGPEADAAHGAIMALHHGSTTDVDGADPSPMFEPGYYLRQDIIWKKPNPMPESVTDRCTKAHEYLFLLSKSEHYRYDADAIAEPSVWAGQGRSARPRTSDCATMSPTAPATPAPSGPSRPRPTPVRTSRRCRPSWRSGASSPARASATSCSIRSSEAARSAWSPSRTGAAGSAASCSRSTSR
jgi:hypothetical protein